MDTAYITHTDCALHSGGEQHPECKERLSAISKHLIAYGFWDSLIHVNARPATRPEIVGAHSEQHFEAISEAIPITGLHYIDPDTAVSTGSLKAALRAAGALAQAVDLVMDDNQHPSLKRAFCAVRPPGHHAERDRAMGFCLFNNIAVGARHALSYPGIERVAIVDFDVHHGNGTENIFAADPQVLFCSAFQHPYYPFTDLQNPANNIVHVPLPAGTESVSFRQAIEQGWLPQLRNFRPQIILISAGFDGSRHDPLANWLLEAEDYYWVTDQLGQIADEFAENRMISTLEGGYNLDHLGSCVAEHLRALVQY
ncbi:MAG: deacetylase [Cellvibrionales bacterium]|nr:MAG: deacetylase [Cellvibrionales bacterium]